MIALELHKDTGVLVVEPKGALSADDFQEIGRTVDPYIAETGKLTGLLIKAPSFAGWDSFGALVEHLKFVRDHQQKIDRVAAVTDSAILAMGPAIARPFVHPEIRVFGSGEGERAMNWVETGA
jgi:hypothetical protein